MQALHHPITSSIKPMDSPSSSGSSSGSSAADSDASITANDFLTLLVAEMKNQDPTADTDPNAYIDQLVQVNSLQQLIQINQDLGGDSSTTSSSGSGSASGSSSGSNESSNPSAQAMSAASRLATSLTAKHPQPGSADGSAVVQSQSAAPQAATAFQTELHKS